jgi:undecaprenyl-diphosphatase
MKQRFPRVQRFVAARLSPAEVFGLHLSAGLALLLVAAGMFAFIAHNVVVQAPLTVLDLRIAARFHTYANSGWTVFMLAITHAHATVPLLIWAALFGLYLAGVRAYYWLLTLAVTVPLGMLLNVGLKHIFQRARPAFDEPLVMLTTYSFPSGHAAGSTLLYGVLAAYCVCRLRSRAARCAACIAATTMVLLVCLSRVYLGAHFLSDVMAGITVGICWLTVCITATATFRRHRMRGGA